MLGSDSRYMIARGQIDENRLDLLKHHLDRRAKIGDGGKGQLSWVFPMVFVDLCLPLIPSLRPPRILREHDLAVDYGPLGLMIYLDTAHEHYLFSSPKIIVWCWGNPA